MPKFKRLSAEELETFRPAVTGERARVRDEYRGYLKGLHVGEGGELQLADEEKKITIKNRLRRAAEDMNLGIEFKRSSDNSVRFRLKPLD